MNDAEYLFKQTSQERKRIGRGDYNKKRQGGRTIRFPSDHLTKKELAAMNGEAKTYHMEKPVTWPVFKKWPEDLQRAYLLGLREKFNAYTKPVAEMFGVNPWTLSQLQERIGIGLTRGGRRPELKEKEWAEFLGAVPEEVPLPTEPEISTENVVDEPEIHTKNVEPDGPQPELPLPEDFDRALNLAMLILALKGSGTELTFKVVL